MTSKNTNNTNNTTNNTNNTNNNTNNTFATAKAEAAAENIKISQLFAEAVKPTRLAFAKSRMKALRALDKCTSDKYSEWKACLAATYISADAELEAFERADLAKCAATKRAALDEAAAKRKAKEDAKAKEEALTPYKNKAHDLLLEALKKAPKARSAYDKYLHVCAGYIDGVKI